VRHSKFGWPMAEMGQKPALPRRSIAVRFASNKQTPTGRVQCGVRCQDRTHAAQQNGARGPRDGMIACAPTAPPGARHENSPPQISASGSGCCRAPAHLAHRIGANLSDEIGALDCWVCKARTCQWRPAMLTGHCWRCSTASGSICACPTPWAITPNGWTAALTTH
jgi:hypothetical protein